HKALDPELGHSDEAKPLVPAIRPASLSLATDPEPEKTKSPSAPKKAVRRHRPEQMSVLAQYQPPPLTLLKEDPGMKKTPQEIREIRELGRKLEETLENFGVDAQIVNYTTGPTITRFELAPGPGIKVSRIVNLSDDIALSLAAMGVRIEAPIPGKAAIGIEIPNKKMRPVLLRSLLESPAFQKEKSPLVAALGRDVAGDAILCDLGKMPHLLIAGATGSGKSVCINSILISILYRSSPKEVRMLMIDPKIVELNVYNGIPHLLQPVVTDPEKAYGVLNYAVAEMERRYRLFAERKVRDIASYNKAVKRTEKEEEEEGPLPYILIVIDELADLMAVTQHQVESAISRLMAKARAVGIHVIIATQRPSVDVITGVIKANIPSRIAFAVASQVDSRTIIDSGGAEKLLGRGDMLYFPLGSIKAIRGQGSFVSNSEVERILSFIKSYYPENYDEKVAAALENPDGPDKAGMVDDGEDELLMEALRVVVEADYAAVSLLQRKLQVGYPRAARLVDRLSELGYVGPFEGSKPRKVLINRDQYDRLSLDDEEGGDQDLD
ncbi:MAG TPA: DNA translocase FtsK, partial [Clostridia bacterium]|nr:DNA translocase FtsK [Clostridia bacterium]